MRSCLIGLQKYFSILSLDEINQYHRSFNDSEKPLKLILFIGHAQVFVEACQKCL